MKYHEFFEYALIGMKNARDQLREGWEENGERKGFDYTTHRLIQLKMNTDLYQLRSCLTNLKGGD